MATVAYGWCRVEGATVTNTQKAYGYTLTSPIGSESIFYGRPSIQIYNKTSTILGVTYKVVPIEEITGYATIKDIDANYTAFQSAIANYDKTINTGDATNAAQLYYKEFAIDKPSVIFYDDTTQGQFRYYAIVYVDADLAPPILAITAKYIGNPIPVDLEFNTDDLRIYAEYEDGSVDRVLDGYTIDPSDITIKKVGVNVFKILFVTNAGDTLTSQVGIQGIKRLTGIQGKYDGPSLYQGQTVERRYLIVTALYSDGSSGTVTSYGFPNGNILGKLPSIEISYNGERCFVDIPTYAISTSRLVAYYTGPNIEVDDKNPNTFDTTKTNIRIHYQSIDSSLGGWETIDSSLCTFTPNVIEHEGINNILVQYVGKNGPVSCYMMVIGFKPNVIMTALTAEYTGPEIVQDKTYSQERLIVKAYYSDGTVVTIKNGYLVNSNIVKNIGINTFTVTYTDRPSSGDDVTLTATFDVIGLEKDTTTDTTYSPISLLNNYPEATRYNNRYRGPAEAEKHHNTNKMIFENIKELYKIFRDIEQSFNDVINSVGNESAIKYLSLNQINRLHDTVTIIMTDKRFSSGKYLKEEENE